MNLSAFHDIELCSYHIVTYPFSTSQCSIPATIPFVTENVMKRVLGVTGEGSYLPSTPAAVSIITFPSL